MNILAKSDGTTLINHSILVSKFAVEIGKQSMLDIDNDLLECIRLSGLLHDIGKCTKQFQKKINNSIDNIEIQELPYRHNEIGWSFISRFLNKPNKVLSIILDNVYWHHGITNNLCSYNDTDIKIDEKDINEMKLFLSNFVDENEIIEKEYKPKKSPKYYVTGDECDEINSERLFTRTCIISGDRIASQYNNINLTDDEIRDIIINMNLKNNTIDVKKHMYYGNERFNLQQEIVKITDRTTQINAPAGFGKTILGLLWNFNSNKKLIWVCPRNIVAESVYNSIIEELKNFKNDTISVELFLSGEVKNKNHSNETGDFSSDIIVTNIDNYLSPSVDNRNGIRLHTIINSDVVFDEFHELIGETSLFSCFINIMLTRHRLTNTNTLLLSATATNMYKLWDSNNQKTKILPNKGQHYPAPHKQKYKLNTTNEIDIEHKKTNNLFLFNSIGNSQIYKKELKSDILIHSSFEDFDREMNIKKLYDYYGKKTTRNIIKPDVVGTHIIQASLDVSFHHLYESILSPQSTLQRIGRCNRWGDINEQSTINIINLSDRSEVNVRNILYTNKLSNLWFSYISKYNQQFLTLDDLYKIYNDFESENEVELYKYLRDMYTSSLDSLTYIYPVKFFNTSKNKTNKTAGSNKLRSSNFETFVICHYFDDKNKFTNPISISVLGNNYTEQFKESGCNIFKKILGVMKLLTNDIRFDYITILKNKKYLTLDTVRKHGKKSNTPYVRFDKVYHPEFGLISPENLSNIIN